jgi:hypothetical protein
MRAGAAEGSSSAPNAQKKFGWLTIAIPPSSCVRRTPQASASSTLPNFFPPMRRRWQSALMCTCWPAPRSVISSPRMSTNPGRSTPRIQFGSVSLL